MVESFFGFSEPPFSNTPDPRFFSPTMNQREALNALRSGIRLKKGFFVLTGDVGTGKTTLCRAMLKMQDRDIATALVLNSDLSEEDILKAILMDFGIAVDGMTKFTLMECLYSYLADRAGLGRTTLIVIDDAQNLPDRSLEQIRMISNFETDKEKLVQILLVGQPELDEKLNSHAFRQISQRIAVRVSLLPLLASETEMYVRQRLDQGGGKSARDIFSAGALRAIHRESGGYPRTVNTLCDLALIEACRLRRKRIDAPLIRRVARAIGLPQARRSRLKERLRSLKWLAAASFAAAAAMGVLHLAATAPGRDGDAAAGWERRFSAVEQSLLAVERRLSARGAVEPRRLGGGGEAELKKEEQRKAREVERIEGELDRLRRQLQDTQIENEMMARELQNMERESAAVSSGGETDVTDALIRQLLDENRELAEKQQLMQSMASQTIRSQNERIERLSVEREKLIESLRKLKPVDLSDETTMLTTSPQQ